MKYEKLAVVIIFLFSYFTGSTQNANLIVEIKDISSTQGKLMVGIFDNPTDFKLKTNPVYKQIVSPSDSAVSYSFKSVSKGIYAIAVFHDTNENGSLDTKKLGIPSEGVGFSGILSKGIKPPDFEEASFNLVNDTIIAISLKYPRKKGD